MPGYLAPAYRLPNCCCCISLRTGCRIIGILTTLVCSLHLIFACRKLIELLEKERHCMDNVDWNEPERPYINICSHIKVVQFMLIIDFIIFVIGLNGSVLLLYGIKSKQPKLFLAWMVFSGMVIFSNFFSILIWHNMSIINNIFYVIVLSYSFKVVRSYHLQLHEELSGGCPVVAVAIPQEPDMRVFLPSHRPFTASDYIKDEPPPPYPGLPIVASSLSIDSQPPPYSLVNPNYEGTPNVTEASTSATSRATELQENDAGKTPPPVGFQDSPVQSERQDRSSDTPETSLSGIETCPETSVRNSAVGGLTPASSCNQIGASPEDENVSLSGNQTEDHESFKSVQSFSRSSSSISEMPTNQKDSS